MTKKQKGAKVCDRLEEIYPEEVKCYLNHDSPWELLCATILSAQCTDERVNKVTPALFTAFPDVFATACADASAIEEIVRPCGFYHTKAEHIWAAAKKIAKDHGGEVPSDIDALTDLPGVGRKTANVIRGNIYKIPSIVVDTHVYRVSKLLGLAETNDPTRVEAELMSVLPIERWITYNHRVIAHGRAVCVARRPRCNACGLAEFCAAKGGE